MPASRPTAHTDGFHARPGHGTVRRDLHSDWDRAFGTVAFAGGLLILLTDLPLVFLGIFLGVVLLAAALLCVARVLPGQAPTAFAMGALGLVLFIPLTGATDAMPVMYRIFAGSLLSLFGIVKLT